MGGKIGENLPEKWTNNHYVQNECLHVLFGYRLYRNWVMPVPTYHISGTMCLTGVAFICFLNPDDIQLIFDAIHYALHMVVMISCASQLLIYRKPIEALNNKLDEWFHYKELEEETILIRKEAEKKSHSITYPYLSVMFGCSGPFCAVPLLKLYLSNDRSKMISFLIFPIYLGFPFETWWGYCLTYAFEVTVVLFAYTLYARLAAYTAVVTIHVQYQMKLMGVALATIEERAKKITKKLGYSEHAPNWETQYEIALYNEAVRTAVHLEYLQGLSQVIIKVFTPVITSTYIGGMWLICLSGVLLATMSEETELVIKFCLLFCSELISLFIYSLASDYLLSSFTEAITYIYFCPWYDLPKPCCKIFLIMMSLLRKVPSLKTMMNYHANIENMGNILNASYTYFSLIIAMKK